MADNFIQQGKVLILPTASGEVSGNTFVVGSYLPGVLIADAEAASPYNAPVQIEGVFDLSVYGHDGTSNAAISVGDKVYWTDSSSPLDVDTAQTEFGIALEAVSSGDTDTIKVLVRSGA